ncbi:AfsR/SARP family transcriptional regulator [Nocardiopsis synnemataformans]|uniref:AfsR/SARP family transcriptional regulator n=1 Tax=Nocardiopsis synnemataformans TaxID=61305 RepID=UPI003EBB2EEB
MRYELLGSLRLNDDGALSVLDSRKVETLLAALLIRSDQVVTSEQLITELWGNRLPNRATAGLHVYVSQLRKSLRSPERPDSPVVTRSPGYLLRLGGDETDVDVFNELTARGRAHVGAELHEKALEAFERALALWRGPALSEFGNGPIIDGFVAQITEARLECSEELIATYLRLGRHREVVGRLFALISEHPLRETFHRQLMLALYRSERQAEALHVYHMARKRLHDEMGLEPGQALQDLQHAILTADTEGVERYGAETEHWAIA